MTIAGARKFLNQAIREDALRDALNSAAGAPEREQILAARGLRFTIGEFEEAWRNELTKCQTEALAEQLHQVNQWWQLLSRFD